MKNPRLSKWLPPLLPGIAAITSGVLLALAFPPASLGFLSFVALVPVVVALYLRPYPPGAFFRTGYLFGGVFFLGHLWWIVELSPSASITIPWLMLPALVLLVLYLSLYPALVFLLARLFTRGHRRASIVVIPALWALTEIFRSTGEFGFPWGAIAHALAPFPAFIQPASVVGVFGLGILVVFINMIWSGAFLERKARTRLLYALGGGLLLAFVGLYGGNRVGDFRVDRTSEPITVAVAQPNVDLRIKWKPAFTDSTFRLIERLCREAAPMRPDLIVFPETSAPVYMRYQPGYMNLLVDLARELDTAIYIGFLDGRTDGLDDSLAVYNSSGLFDTDGRFEQYDKVHLLPFGEAVPFAWKFRVLQKLDFGQANFRPGPVREPTSSSVGKLGPMICFESIFPDLARRHVAGGAEILLNITNDGWFGLTPGPHQHNEMAIFRAVENNRYLVRSANSGISMVVDPVGRVVSSLGLGQGGILSEDITGLKNRTIYNRAGDTPVVLGALVLVAVGTLWARRSTR